jgi:hypothetical protein
VVDTLTRESYTSPKEGVEVLCDRFEVQSARPMLYHPTEQQQSRAEVHFLLWVLERHRALEKPRSLHWQEREAYLLRRLAQAQVKLDRAQDTAA